MANTNRSVACANANTSLQLPVVGSAAPSPIRRPVAQARAPKESTASGLKGRVADVSVDGPLAVPYSGTLTNESAARRSKQI